MTDNEALTASQYAKWCHKPASHIPALTYKDKTFFATGECLEQKYVKKIIKILRDIFVVRKSGYIVMYEIWPGDRLGEGYGQQTFIHVTANYHV